jgi:protein-glutamine gamma-glutamyltransferase
MSAFDEAVSVLGGGRAGRESVHADRRAQPARPLITLTAFAALGLYGVSRWSILLDPRPSSRMLGLLALATVTAGVLGAAVTRGRVARGLAVIVAVLACLAALALAGVPATLIVHGHPRAIWSGISDGLGALPRVLVPYNGADPWVPVVVTLGAAVLVMDAALVLAFAPRSLGDARRAAAAMPLIALAVVPSTLIRPQAPYLQGLLLLALVAALVWGERLRRRDARAALIALALAGAGAMVIGPALDRHRPLLNYEGLAGAFAPTNIETFDWSQRYGPLDWPRTGREVMSVKAAHPDYWKAQNLDVFDGVDWVQGADESTAAIPAPDPNALARWTQRVQVTIRGMRTTDVIAAGFTTQPPEQVPQGVVPGDSPGTWLAGTDLEPGDSYFVTTYSPQPTTAELAATAGQPYPQLYLASYRAITLPGTAPGQPDAGEILFPPFRSHAPAVRITGNTSTGATSNDGAAAMRASPYAGAYALARRLAKGAPTPIAYIKRVERYLSTGFTYNENAPRHRYPLESFLFQDKLGYCQQFSGAMALLLRMGGVPARVSAGFTSGTYDQSLKQWVVSDLDAHAWVEAWFPSYGWVRFDPTPGVAPALGGRGALAVPKFPAGGGASQGQLHRPVHDIPAASRAAAGGGSGLGLILGAGVLVAAGLLAMLALRTARRRAARAAGDPVVFELERALTRSGRPLPPGTTLSQLEHRFRSSPDAAAYIRALRLSRYGAIGHGPTPAQRRALRERLSEGLGVTGRLRALWALPPWPVRGSLTGLRSVLKSSYGRRV